MIELVFGKRGSGKTTLAKKLLNNYDNYIIIDQLNEYSGLIFYDVDTLLDYYEREKKFNCVFRPLNDVELELIFHIYKIGHITFFIEEIDMIATAYNMPADLKYILKYGRHYDISIVGICRRTQETNRLLTSQANSIWVSRMQENSDVAYFKKMGFDENQLRNLKDFEFINMKF